METIQQEGFDENKVSLDSSFITDNRVLITDFFGDNRAWYEKLLKGGMRFGKTGLDSQDEYDADLSDEEEKDLPPLDPERITQGRAGSIAAFFVEYPEAQKTFLEYQAHAEKNA